MNHKPVFIVGSARSGTTLLYHMLLSAGGFAVFHGETHAYDVLGPRYAHLKNQPMRERFLNAWLPSRHFELCKLDAEEVRSRVTNECKNTGDFLRVVMGMIATKQGVNRWADCTPAHISHIHSIHREIPDALFVHIIRDGRDVALSASRLGWFRPLPHDTTSPKLLAGLAWRWSVRSGQKAGLDLKSQYLEVRFEDLVRSPENTLARVSEFIDHPLDYEQIKAVGLGSVSRPNSSFRASGNSFDPIGRFKTGFVNGELEELEFLIGDLLDELGYQRGSPNVSAAPASLTVKRLVYDRFLSGKLWARVNTPLGRRTSLASIRNW